VTGDGSKADARPSVDLMEGKLRGAGFSVLRTFLLLLFRLLFRLRIDGLNNIPREGGVLVVSNHLHNADPVMISAAFPRPMHYMAKKELMSVPVLGRVIRFGGAFPVDRGKADRHAIQMATDRLQQGIPVGMFPEGTRSVTRRIERVLPGAGLIALRGNVPIVPVAIVGSERLPFNGAKQMRHGEGKPRPWGVTITFGEPFRLEPKPDGKRLTSEEAINLAMMKVAEMLPEEYRGIFGTDAVAG
jgi:1-acyl-sn-glycerol-3-phosphate acyltransferase